ncbi:MAG: helix-turn-helix domain-containing protein [Nitrosopumilaceae archaeon]|nr:helix-turn-helix domain-containing protein [Nitrosopumilaceae archaeon]
MIQIQEETEKLVRDLQEILDLDEVESRIYLNLLRTGPITASALAKNLEIDRARTYRTVDRLVDRNIVSTTLSNPRHCFAVDLDDVLKNSLEKKEKELKKIKRSGELIIDKINQDLNTNRRTDFPTLRIVQGRSNIYNDISKMIENCSDVIYVATTLEDISKMYHSSIPEKIRICKKNGGIVRLLVEVEDIDMISFVKRFNASETRMCQLPSGGRIVVQKGNQLIISDSGVTISNNETDFSVCTNAEAMINSIEKLCGLLWESGKPLKES